MCTPYVLPGFSPWIDISSLGKSFLREIRITVRSISDDYGRITVSQGTRQEWCCFSRSVVFLGFHSSCSSIGQKDNSPARFRHDHLSLCGVELRPERGLHQGNANAGSGSGRVLLRLHDVHSAKGDDWQTAASVVWWVTVTPWQVTVALYKVTLERELQTVNGGDKSSFKPLESERLEPSGVRGPIGAGRGGARNQRGPEYPLACLASPLTTNLVRYNRCEKRGGRKGKISDWAWIGLSDERACGLKRRILHFQIWTKGWSSILITLLVMFNKIKSTTCTINNNNIYYLKQNKSVMFHDSLSKAMSR